MKLAKAFYAIWTENQLPNQAAALAFYAIFALAPLLVLIIELVGFVPGFTHHSVLREHIFDLVGKDVGPPAETIVRSLVDASFQKSQNQSVLMSIVGWGTMLLAATGLFATVQGSLEQIWKTAPQGGIVSVIVNRAISFAVIVVLAAASLVWIGASAVVDIWTKTLPPSGGVLGVLGDVVVEWLVASVALAVVFKVLPRARVRWRPILIGAACTSALIVVGQYAIGWYLSRSTSGSAYGVAGAFVALLLWIYYSAQLFLGGAAFTRALASPDAGAGEKEPAGAVEPTPVHVIAEQTSDDQRLGEREPERSRG